MTVLTSNSCFDWFWEDGFFVKKTLFGISQLHRRIHVIMWLGDLPILLQSILRTERFRLIHRWIQSRQHGFALIPAANLDWTFLQAESSWGIWVFVALLHGTRHLCIQTTPFVVLRIFVHGLAGIARSHNCLRSNAAIHVLIMILPRLSISLLRSIKWMLKRLICYFCISD